MQTLDLEKIVHQDLFILDSAATNKAEILQELGALLKKNDYIKDEEAFLKDVYLRESEGETGIGDGIAIPHGKSTAVMKTTIAIGTLKNTIEWETLDGKGVQVVILFAVKDTDANTTHILLLQKVATLLADESFIAELKTVQSKDDLYNLILTSQKER